LLDSITRFVNKDIIPIQKEGASFSYNHVFDTSANKINRVSIDLGIISNNLKINELNKSTTINYSNDHSSLRNFMIRSNSNNKIYAGSVNYNLGSKKSGIIETGYKVSESINNNNYFGKDDSSGSPSRFRYNEIVNSLYFNYSKNWERLGANVGMRYENSNISIKKN